MNLVGVRVARTVSGDRGPESALDVSNENTDRPRFAEVLERLIGLHDRPEADVSDPLAQTTFSAFNEQGTSDDEVRFDSCCHSLINLLLLAKISLARDMEKEIEAMNIGA
ncbi:hypothetical protein [Paraburkholderia atlantica]|uniref:hypothetical protein n=1 Tax=Paraburkholderia atlantica TaxID=2654982 RepID=UPI003D1DB6B7